MINEQDQKEFDEREKHKPQSYVPEHLKPHSGLEGHGLFKKLMGEGTITVEGDLEDALEKIEPQLRRNSRGEMIEYT